MQALRWILASPFPRETGRVLYLSGSDGYYPTQLPASGLPAGSMPARQSLGWLHRAPWPKDIGYRPNNPQRDNRTSDGGLSENMRGLYTASTVSR